MVKWRYLGLKKFIIFIAYFTYQNVILFLLFRKKLSKNLQNVDQNFRLGCPAKKISLQNLGFWGSEVSREPGKFVFNNTFLIYIYISENIFKFNAMLDNWQLKNNLQIDWVTINHPSKHPSIYLKISYVHHVITISTFGPKGN